MGSLRDSARKSFTVVKSPTDELSLLNRVILHEKHKAAFGYIKDADIAWCVVRMQYHFAVKFDSAISDEGAGFNKVQREWIGLDIGQSVPIDYVQRHNYFVIHTIHLSVDFLLKPKTPSGKFDTEKMALEFSKKFKDQPFKKNQKMLFKYEEMPYLTLFVDNVEGDFLTCPEKVPEISSDSPGILSVNARIVFDRREGSNINLIGRHKGQMQVPSLFDQNWDFTKIGVGGLDKEFSVIFRRAFASRLFPPDLVDELGIKHTKGILLYGPPGTGKTLMARQIGKMLNAREPKIVNGPEILNKYVGESEANVRKLFEDAEAEQKKEGRNSGLHMIIFDEIDAICKQRGSVGGGTGVHDTVVNQLLSKIDGVEQLNNILVIGMTNRKDMIDEALLRPGRLEVQMEITLPNEEGRLQIFRIHTSSLVKNKKLSQEVSLQDLAKRTKNFSGAEIEGLVRAASVTAMNRLVKMKEKVAVENIDQLLVTKEDFDQAMAQDIKPAFGADEEDFESYKGHGIYEYGSPVQDILSNGSLLIKQTRDGRLVSPVSVLLEGPEGSGKTALAANIAMRSGFPFIKICSPENMITFTETAKSQAIKKIFEDAYKSELSCIVVDDIERLIDYVPIGPRFSNVVLQTLLVLLKKTLKKDRKLLIIGTSSCRDVLDQLQLLSSFNTIIHVPSIVRRDHFLNVLKEIRYFDSTSELIEIENQTCSKRLNVSIKKLISLAEMAYQQDDADPLQINKVNKFISLLENQGCLREAGEAMAVESSLAIGTDSVN